MKYFVLTERQVEVVLEALTSADEDIHDEVWRGDESVKTKEVHELIDIFEKGGGQWTS